MSKYVPLQKYLSRQPGEQTPLSFGEIERILGFPLPPSARKHAAWWSNNVGTHVGVRAWREAGWKTSEVDQGSERVVFVRDHDSSPVSMTDNAIRVPRDLLAPATLRFLAQQAARSGDEAAAAAAVLNEAAMHRRKLLMDRLSATAPHVEGDSADLIREDRDGR